MSLSALKAVIFVCVMSAVLFVYSGYHYFGKKKQIKQLV